MKLTDELVKEREVRGQKEVKELESDLLVQEVKQHMENSSREEQSLLKQIGLGHNISKFEEEGKNRLSVENREEFHGAAVFTGEDIKAVCVKYNLRFLGVELYNGTVPPETASIVRRFAEKADIPDYRLSPENFKIMAPKEMFELQVFPNDPMLFWNMGGGQFALVHQWGEDLTWKRRVSAWFLENSITNFFIQSLLPLVIVVVLGVIAGALVSLIAWLIGFMVSESTVFYWGQIFFIPFFIVGGLASLLMIPSIKSDLEEEKDEDRALITPIKPSNVWNLPFKKA